jgi:hypothetical protein
MKRKKIWFLVLILGLMTLSTVIYVTMLRNAKTSYANGRLVWQEESVKNPYMTDFSHENLVPRPQIYRLSERHRY